MGMMTQTTSLPRIAVDHCGTPPESRSPEAGSCRARPGVIAAACVAAALLLLAGIPLCRPAAADPMWGGDRLDFTVDGYPAFLVQPPPSGNEGSSPWLWYAPFRLGILPDSSNAWLFQRLVQNGFWICGVDVGESYGSPAGRQIYSAFYDTLLYLYDLKPRACLLAQSRGGLMLYNWAADPGNNWKVSRIAGIFPVGDLASFPGLNVAAPAYNMTPQELQDSLTENDPIDRLAPLVDANVKIFHIHGDADTLVPLAANSQVVYDRYTALGGTMILEVVPGLGHVESPAFFQSQDMLNFLLEDLSTAAVRGPADRNAMALRVWPNPVNFARGGAAISYQLPSQMPVRLTVMDVAGRIVSRLVDGTEAQGRHRVVWGSAESARAGVYFVVLQANGQRWSRRVLVLN